MIRDLADETIRLLMENPQLSKEERDRFEVALLIRDLRELCAEKLRRERQRVKN